MRWLVAQYQPVSLFSLKHGEATSTGGKSLLIPTPFAIRTALLDVAIRVHGLAEGQQAFEHVRVLRLAVRPPPRIAVTHLFVKVLKPERDAESDHAMQHSIAFREYVYLNGTLSLALGGEKDDLQAVASLLPHISYFGKRGSFFQILTMPEEAYTEEVVAPPGFLLLTGMTFTNGRPTGVRQETFPLGVMQRLDDWGPELTFERVNIYSEDRIRPGRDRIAQDVILPYRMARAGRGFTVYERFET